MKINLSDLKAMRVTVMGLGLHGGGLASALFFARKGARVTVTDHRQDKKALELSLDQLKAMDIRLVLGKHEEKDFIETDLIIKNPAVPDSSPFLGIARSKGVPIETDLSVFLDLSDNPIIAVTGSKGKSTTASAIHYCVKKSFPGAKLGGNITVSPLIFLDHLQKKDPVVLELSSWQLADLKGKKSLSPQISLITTLLADHQDKYQDMRTYIADKKILFQAQSPKSFAIFNYQDPLQKDFAQETKAKVRYFSDRPLNRSFKGAYLKNEIGWISEGGRTVKILTKKLSMPGAHNRLNLLSAALASFLFGLYPESIADSLKNFPGIEHRLEYFHEKNGIKFYNDSASTIPQATCAALKSIEPPVILICGGTDKNLDLEPLLEFIGIPRKIFLLQGSATAKIRELLDRQGISYEGPFVNLEAVVSQAYSQGTPGSSILFSPGCASFGMFLNEFDRGRKFKKIVLAL